MFKIVLISLALTGLQALPISRSLTKTHHDLPSGVHHDLPSGVKDGLPGFRQGTEPSRRLIVDLNTGLVQDYVSEMDRRTGLFFAPSLEKGHGEMDRSQMLYTAEEIPVQKNGNGWVRVEERATLPDGFRQGTEPSLRIAEGFRQGTEPSSRLPDGFRQGTEPSSRIPDGFRQGTEPSSRLPDGFRQGTEPSLRIPEGFRQGTEPSLRIPDGFRQGTERFMPLPDGFRQGTEPSFRIPKGFRQGTEPTDPVAYRNTANTIPDGFRQGTEPSLRIPNGFRQGTEPTDPVAYRNSALSVKSRPGNTIPDGFRQGTEPSLRIPVGFRQGTEPSLRIPDGFRQGTERFMPLPDGFRQGTEPSFRIPNGFRQGTEPTDPVAYRNTANTIPDGFRQGTEPSLRIPDGFRQGTERFMPLLDGFRQGTEPSLSIPKGFRQGTEPTDPVAYRNAANTIPDGFRQGTEPSLHVPDVAMSFNGQPAEPSNQIAEDFRPGNGPFMPVRDGDQSNYIQASFSHVNEALEPSTAKCNGDIINGRCYTFNPTPMPFLEAQDSCKSINPNAALASVTDKDIHSRLVSLVTNGGQRDPVLTWLGGIVKNQRGSWVDGSEWGYSDWMSGRPNIYTDKPVCMEMFFMGETWWSAADCDLKRASICSYPVV